MKNVQIIDGAVNCKYSIYSFTDEDFSTIFPAPGQNIEFIEDVEERIGEKALVELNRKIWQRPVNKETVVGIHGTLFYQLLKKKPYYPTKRETDID